MGQRQTKSTTRRGQSAPAKTSWNAPPRMAPASRPVDDLPVVNPGDVQEEIPAASDIRIMSWNLDGLFKDGLQERTAAAIAHIKKLQPDVLYLQEVVGASRPHIEHQLKGIYEGVQGGEKLTRYFTMIFWRKDTVELMADGVTRKPFVNSRMSRDLLCVQASVKGVAMTLMTSHLESMPEDSKERLNQLQTAFDVMGEEPANQNVVFAGDLNLMDGEVESIGGPPDNIYDLWQTTGSIPSTEITWDMTVNDNRQVSPPPQRRLDRMYLRHRESPPGASELKPVGFNLVGKERTRAGFYPSDHWGIVTDFQKTMD